MVGINMKNRAKCKLCQSIIESFHSTDYVVCNCGEIFVDGGAALGCGANEWFNFLRVDDQGNEIVVKVQEKEEIEPIPESHKPNKKQLLDMLDEMIKNVENLPSHAMLTPINHYDYCSLMILLSSIFRSDKD